MERLSGTIGESLGTNMRNHKGFDALISQDMNVSKRGSEWEIQNARAVHFLNQPKPWKCPEKVKVNDINPKLQSMWWRCYKQAVDKVCTRKQVAV